jgi:hypothetical protein
MGLASQLCRSLVDVDPRTDRPYERDWLRCMLPTTQSIRWKRVERVHELIGKRFNAEPQDSVTYALFVAYGPSHRQPNRDHPTTVCVLGDPKVQTLFPALSASPLTRNVVVFPIDPAALASQWDRPQSPQPQEQQQPAGVFAPHWKFNEAQAVAAAFNVSLDYASIYDVLRDATRIQQQQRQQQNSGLAQYRHSCDVIQLNADFICNSDDVHCPVTAPHDQWSTTCIHNSQLITRQIVSNLIDYLAKPSSATNRTRLVWTSHHEQNISRHLQRFESLPFVSWQLTSTWFMYNRIGLVADRNGFLQKSYFQSFESSLVTVRIGFFTANKDQLFAASDSSSMTCTDGWFDPVHDDMEEDDVEVTIEAKTLAQRHALNQRFPNIPIVVITTANRLLIDNMFGLREKLLALGFPRVMTVADFSLLTFEIIEEQARKQGRQILQISVAPTDIELFSLYYVVFNCEQHWSELAFGIGWKRFESVLRSSVGIWTFIDKNAQFMDQQLQEFSNITMPVFAVPFYYTNDRHDERPLSDWTTANSPRLFRDDEESTLLPNFVFFFGSYSERRGVAIETINHHIRQSTSLAAINLRFVFMSGGWPQLLFDAERDFYIRKSRAVINVPQALCASPELHRLLFLQSMHGLVISEYPPCNHSSVVSNCSESNLDQRVNDLLNRKVMDGVIGVNSLTELTESLDMLFQLPVDSIQQRLDTYKQRSLQAFYKSNNNLSPLKIAMESALNVMRNTICMIGNADR